MANRPRGYGLTAEIASKVKSGLFKYQFKSNRSIFYPGKTYVMTMFSYDNVA